MNEIKQLKKLMEAVDSPYEVVDERQSIAVAPDAYNIDINLDADDVTVYTHGGEPVFAMPIEDWKSLVSKFNRNYRPR